MRGLARNREAKLWTMSSVVFEFAIWWIKAYASSPSWLARTDDVEDGLLFPFGYLIAFNCNIKHAFPFDVCSRFPLVNSIMLEIIFISMLNFPAGCFLIYPEFVGLSFSPLGISFGFIGDARLECLH